MSNQSKSRSKKRLPRLKRVPVEQRPPLYMKDRDIDIIRTIYKYRALTSDQIERLLFVEPGKPKPKNSRCNVRLQALFHHEFIFRDEQPRKVHEGRKPLIYFLDKRGAEFLAELDGRDVSEIEWKPSYNDVKSDFLDHTLATNDVRVDIALACQLKGYQLINWIDETTLRSDETREYVYLDTGRGTKQRFALVPDGYFTIEADGGRFHTLLEIDMGTQSGTVIKRKVRSYLHFEKSGRYKAKYGVKSTMRVLFVTKGDIRTENLRKVAEENEGQHRFWFTTFDRITANSFFHDPIWRVAGRDKVQAFIT